MVLRVKEANVVGWKVLKALIVSPAAILYQPLLENILFLLTSLIIMLSGKIRHLHHGFQGKETKPVGWKVQKALIVSLAAILYQPLPENKLCLLRSFIMLSGKIRHLHHGF